MIIQIADVPAVALDRIIEEFEKHGWEFIRVNRFKGAGKCVAGMATWEWEDDVLTVNTRLRQRCRACDLLAAQAEDPTLLADCDHYPHSMILTFNPSHPGHWLRRWFILGSVPTEWGHRKEELTPLGQDTWAA